MPEMLQIRSDTDLKALGRALRQSGDRDLRQGVFQGINRATKRVKPVIAESARTSLPGGLGDLVADLNITTVARLSGASVGVRLVSTKSKAAHMAARRRAVARRLGTKRAPRGTAVRGGLIDLRKLNDGMARHPTYGHRPWVLQPVDPGFFDRPMRMVVAYRVQNEIWNVVDSALERLAHSG